MICNRCLARIGQRSRRTFTTSTTLRAEAVSVQSSTSTNPRPHGKPAATTTSAAQPFTAGVLPKIKPAAPKVVRTPSIALAGTSLRGINYMKNLTDPIAKPDNEYPDWLWTALDKKAAEDADADGEGDLFSKSKKQRRLAAKALRKKQLRDPDALTPKIPLYEQTIDIYAGDGTLEGSKQAVKARQELTKSMRNNRRSKIKEANFLKTMG